MDQILHWEKFYAKPKCCSEQPVWTLVDKNTGRQHKKHGPKEPWGAHWHHLTNTMDQSVWPQQYMTKFYMLVSSEIASVEHYLDSPQPKHILGWNEVHLHVLVEIALIMTNQKQHLKQRKIKQIFDTDLKLHHWLENQYKYSIMTFSTILQVQSVPKNPGLM